MIDTISKNNAVTTATVAPYPKFTLDLPPKNWWNMYGKVTSVA
jgi:hypothetical protein